MKLFLSILTLWAVSFAALPPGTTHYMDIVVTGTRVNETSSNFVHQYDLSDSISVIDAVIDSAKHILICDPTNDTVYLYPRDVIYTAGSKLLLYWDGPKAVNTNDTFRVCFGTTLTGVNSTATYTNSSETNRWGIDKFSGNTFYDYVGSNNGTGTSVDTASSVFGIGSSYNSASDNINVGVLPVLINAATVSFSAVVKWDNFTAIHNVILAYKSSTENFYIQTSTTNLTIRVGSLQAILALSGNLLIDTDYLLALVWDGSQATDANRLKLYLNGVQKTLTFSGTAPATTGDLSTTAFTISGATNSMIGKIDEVSAMSVVRSGSAILDRYRVLFEPSTFYSTGAITAAGPVITAQPQPDTAAVGQSMQFAIAATGDLLHYGWYKNSVYTGDADSVYNFNAAIADHNKYVRCVVWNGADTVWSDSAIVNVVYAIFDSVATSDSLTAYFQGNFLSGSGWTATIGGAELTTGSGSETAQSFVSETPLQVAKKRYTINIADGTYSMNVGFGKSGSGNNKNNLGLGLGL